MTEPTIVWEFSTENAGRTASSAIEADILVHDGVVYVGSSDNHFYAIYAGSGNRRWAFDAGGDVEGGATLSEDGSMVYFGTSSEGFYALSTDDGREVWSWNPNRDLGSFVSAPSVYGDVVVAATDTGKIFAFRADEFRLLWEYPDDRDEHVGSFEQSGVILDGSFFIGSEDGTLYGIDIDTGRKESGPTINHQNMLYWKEAVSSDGGRQPDIEPLRSEVVTDGAAMYFGNDAGEVYHHDGNRNRWSYKVGGAVRGNLSTNGEILVFADRTGEIVAVNPDERYAFWEDDEDEDSARSVLKTVPRLWREYVDSREGRKIIGGPILAGDRVFVIDNTGLLYVYDAEEGDELHQIQLWTSQRVCAICKSAPAVEDDMLFVGTGDGRILGIRLPPEE